MIQVLRSNNLVFKNLPAELRRQFIDYLTIENPSYEKVVRSAGSRYAAQTHFRYYKTDKETEDLIVPLGCDTLLVDGYLKKHGIEHEYTARCDGKTSSLFIPKEPELRDYQIPIVDTMVGAEKGGLVVAGTGAGKTLLVLTSIKRQHKTALIIARNTKDLAQYRNKARDMYGVTLGEYYGKKKDIQDVTVTTWNSLEQVAEQGGVFSHIYIDECHTAVSNKRIKTLERFAPSKIYGLTGSPRKSKDDGRTPVIRFVCGGLIYKYEVTPLTPKVYAKRTDADIKRIQVQEFANGRVRYDYNGIVEQIVESDSRNLMIAGIATGEALTGRKVLILCKRRRHCDILLERLSAFPGVVYVDAQAKDCDEVLDKLSCGDMEFNIVIGTVSLIGTGTDIPSLDTMILAADMKSDVLLQQGAGRILRWFSGKEQPLIYDMVDNKNNELFNHFKERLSFYKSMGWELIGDYT